MKAFTARLLAAISVPSPARITTACSGLADRTATGLGRVGAKFSWNANPCPPALLRLARGPLHHRLSYFPDVREARPGRTIRFVPNTRWLAVNFTRPAGIRPIQRTRSEFDVGVHCAVHCAQRASDDPRSIRQSGEMLTVGPSAGAAADKGRKWS